MKLVVDANIFISALIGGKAAELLFNPNFDLLTTERTTWEVKKYLPLDFLAAGFLSFTLREQKKYLF
jgi:predicted nucleic acid-binding protein